MAERLMEALLAGDRRALSRAFTRVEARDEAFLDALAALPVRRRIAPGEPHVVGLTGPPGSGKSTLTSALIAGARASGRVVGVVAVDPSSPFTGGAVLGDRLRMERHAGDAGVFIRSVASRGHLGGISPSVAPLVDFFDAAGFDRIFVETVGVGQSELQIMGVADTVVVVLTPESGDTVQTMKAGLLEVADVFVVNKSDRPGADLLERDLRDLARLEREIDPVGHPREIPVVQVQALHGKGLEALSSALEDHHVWITGPGRPAWEERRARGRHLLFLDLVGEASRRDAQAALQGDPALAAALREGRTSPYAAFRTWRSRA